MPRLALTIVLFSLLSAARADAPAAPNTLSDQEKKDGWTLLFDGKTTNGWRQLGGGPFPADVWVVKDGELVHLPTKTSNHDIIYDKKFENFELSWEWMIPQKEGNNGVKYRVFEAKGKGGAYGPEYQMMADNDKADKGATASLYELFAPKNKKPTPPGQWFQSRIIVRGNHVEHWLQGEKTVDCEFWNDEFNKAFALSKFKTSKEWGRDPKGYIALTDHHDEAHFRSIKIRELK